MCIFYFLVYVGENIGRAAKQIIHLEIIISVTYEIYLKLYHLRLSFLTILYFHLKKCLQNLPKTKKTFADIKSMQDIAHYL